MKKVLLFVAVVTAASFASCKKDRVCTCTTVSGSFSDVETVTYIDSKKHDARGRCMSESGISSGVAYTTTCELN